MTSVMATSSQNEYYQLTGFLVLFAILLFTTIIRIPTLFEPWGGDQGVYGFIADGILHGKVPYKDMYTNTGYGLYFAYALLFKLFGNNMMALHIGDLLASIITVALVYYLTRLLYGQECAVIAGIAAAFFGSGKSFSYLYELKGAWGTYWQLAQRETFMTPLIAGAILIAIIADRNKRRLPYFWVGILMGLAAIFKITVVGLAVLFVIYLFYIEIFHNSGDGTKFFLSKTTFLFLGFILIQIPFLYYFWIHDSLLTMYRAVFVHTAIYAKLSRGNIIANAFMGNTFILSENLILWVFSLASMIYLMRFQRNRENGLMVVWAIATVLMIWGQGKFFGYHFILIIAPFSVLTGFGIKQFLKTMPTWKESFLYAGRDMTQIFLWILIFGNLSVFLFNQYDYYRWHALYLSGKISKNAYYQVFNEYPLHTYSFRSDYDVANYLKSHAQKNATLRTINGAGDTIINYLSGVKSSTRFTSTWYLFNPSLYENSLTSQLRHEFIQEIKLEKPDYILLVYFSMDEFRQIYKDIKYKDIIMLMNYIKNNYVLEKSFKDRRILYKRL